MVERFKIKQTVELVAILDKYSYCKPQYATNRDELIAFTILDKLDAYEQMFWFTFLELKSGTKMGAFFGINYNYPQRGIKEMKAKIKELRKEVEQQIEL